MNVTRRFLQKVLSRPCPVRIPRSGESGGRVNCFVVAIDRNGEPYCLVEGIDGCELHCKEWSGESYSIEKKVDLNLIDQKDFRISHYYGYSEITFFGIKGLIVGRTLFVEYIKIHAFRVLSAIDQYIFNKKKLVTKQRIDLLKFLVAETLDRKKEFEVIGLMTRLYTIKWVLHPDKDSQIEKVRLYLDSLVDTGELRKVNGKYVLTGYAIRGIEEYEEQERKHTESVKMQRRMFCLTLLIAALTVVQAGLVKLPPMIDVSGQDHDSRNEAAR